MGGMWEAWGRAGGGRQSEKGVIWRPKRGREVAPEEESGRVQSPRHSLPAKISLKVMEGLWRVWSRKKYY